MERFEIGDVVVSLEDDEDILSGGLYLVTAIPNVWSICFLDEEGYPRVRPAANYTLYEIPETFVPLGTPFWEATKAPQATRAGDILREAAGIVDGARNSTHGHKERSFRAIAIVWDAHLSSRPFGRDVPIDAADVAVMMSLLKVKRSEYGEHVEDHGVDLCGYGAIWAEIREAEQAAEEEI